MDTHHKDLATRIASLVANAKRRGFRRKLSGQPTLVSFFSTGKVLAVALAILFVLPTYKVVATQLGLSQSPLYLSTTTPPNIFFLQDDSGSMDWGTMTPENDGIIILGTGSCRNYYYTHPAPGTSASAYAPATNDYTSVVPTEEQLSNRGVASPYGGVWRAWNKDYNKIYYNPNVRYTPWEGIDSTGATYSNALPTAAPYNPYRPSHGTLDLTSSTISYSTTYCPVSGTAFTVSNFYPARYYEWTDNNSDGLVGANESHTLYEIRSSGCTNRDGITATCPTSFTRTSARTDCTVSGTTATCTVAQELQNFANWFSYYRKRDLTAKKAVSTVVASSTDRMGYATLHNNGSASNISILAMNASTSSGNKLTLLSGVFNTRPGNDTPLRTKLNAVGKYFECKSGNIFGFAASSPGSATCPILSAASGGTCQQNFTVVMTDGFWNDSFTGVGNADGDASSSFDNTSPNIAYGDSYSNTLADVAMNYYERDLATTLSDQVPVIAGVDNNNKQHMVTYTVAFGLSGTLSAGPTSPTQSFTWPNPTAGDAQKIDDLRHAAYNGRGEFLSAQDPDQLSTALVNALGSIGNRAGSSSAVAANSVALNTSSAIYQARFKSGEWTGDLSIIQINIDGSIGSLLASSKSALAAQDWSTGRVILARNDSQGIPFRWTTSGANALTAVLQSNLNTDPATATLDNQGSDRLDWLRGRANNEGGGNNYRARNGYKLGDIVNSDPVFVGAPPFLPETETVLHSTFRSTYINRRKMVYVGANDGMFHGFDAATGQEKIAYVPSMVSSSLNKLTNPGYVHQYYVDGSPAYGDAYDTFSNGCSGVACWRTLVVSGLGAGAKGLFALDVTDPDGSNITNLQFTEGNAANIALWEWDGTAANASAKGYNASDLGYIYGRPTIARMQDGEWVVIFGNGYNSARERAILYIVRARDGVVAKSIDFSGADNTSNGLSTPVVVDVNGDNKVDYIYAGDLRGNLWKADVSNASTSTWKTAYGSAPSPAPVFVAVDASNVSQPITSRPVVGQHPGGLSGYMVYFGTGRYLASGDQTPATSPVQTFYGVWDKNSNSGNTPVARADLLPQTISVTTLSGYNVRTITNTAMQWRTGNSGTCQSNGTGTCLGWRDDLRTAYTDALGEMMVTNPILTGSDVLPAVSFTTLIPSNDICSAGGTGFYMLLNPNNGGPLPQQVIDINNDGVIDSNDKANGSVLAGFDLNIGIPSDPIAIYGRGGLGDVPLSGSTGDIKSIRNYFPYGTLGRQSWRQLK